MNKTEIKKLKSCNATREVLGFDNIKDYIAQSKARYTSQGYSKIKAMFIKAGTYTDKKSIYSVFDKKRVRFDSPNKDTIIFKMFDCNGKKIEIEDCLRLNSSLAKKEKGVIYFNSVGYKFVSDNDDTCYCGYKDFIINDNIITIKNNHDIKITLDI